MKLPSFNKKKEEVEYFLSLIIAPHKTAAILFQKKNKSLSILSYKEAIFDKMLGDLTQEELISLCDQVVSGLDMSIPEGAVLSKTIFALPYNWVKEGKVAPPKLELLKKLCEELELTPIGFLIPIEAIVAYLQQKDGVPLSAVVVEHSKNIAIAYVIKGGNILEIKQGVIERGDLTHTVEKLLATITRLDVLPSKIILQDSDGIEKLQQEFLAYHWTQRLPFLHVPQVTVLEKGIENEAIINGVSNQMGFEITSVAASVKTAEPMAIPPLKDAAPPPEKNVPPDQGPPQSEPESPDQGEDTGFFKEQDVADMTPKETPVQEQPPASVHHENRQEIPVHDYNKGDQNQDFQQEELGSNASKSLLSNFSVVSETLSMLKGKVPSVRMPSNLPLSPRLAVPVAGIVLIFGAFVYLYYQFILQSTVIISSDKKTIQEEVPITLGTDMDTSATDSTIKLYTKSIEVSGEASTEATGKEETGKKATGTITFYNKTEQKKTFSKGATVSNGNDLEFELIEEMSIASTSAFSTSYSSSKGKVEAKKFGKEYNLPSNTNFTIDGLPSSNFFGKNDEAFGGGSKEEIQVVSSKDLDALENKVTKDLKPKAHAQAKSQVGDNEVLIDGFLSSKFSEKKFDKKEKDKAKTVKLVATISYEIGYYKKDDIEKFATDYAKDDIPDDYVIKDNKSEFSLKDLETDEKKGSTSAVLGIQAEYSPKINKDIAPELKSKSVSRVTEIVKETDGVENVTVEFKRQIPFLPKLLPFNPKNIIIQVEE